MSGLPRGWNVATLPELISADGVFSDGDWVETKDQDPAGDVRLTQLADIGEGSWRNRSNRYMTAEAAGRLGCTHLQEGDVLVARMPDPLGRACVFPGDVRPSVTAVDVCIVRPGSGSVEPRWLMWWLNSPQIRAEVLARQAGTTRKRISRKNLGAIQLPVPPLAEQQRIVATIEEQLSRLDVGLSTIRSMRKRLSLLRSATLQNAFSRAEERREIGTVAGVMGGHTPKGLQASEGGTLPFYKVGDMNAAHGAVMGVARTYLDAEAIGRYRLALWPPGTVIFPKQGGAIATNKKRMLVEPAACDLNTMGVSPGPELRPRFLLLWLETVDLGSLSDGSVVAQIKRPTVERLQIPWFEAEEQDAIVDELDVRLAAIQHLDDAAGAALLRAASLRAALLTSAFRGELVPQDPDDEPANVLLQRIAAERAAAPMPPRKRREKASA